MSSRTSKVLDPPGFKALQSTQGNSKRTSKAPVRSVPSAADVEALKSKRAWDVAIAPAKSLPMNGFMLYMSGSGVQIFSMMAVGMLLTGPIKGIVSIQQSFAPFSTPGKATALIPQQVTFVACQLMLMALGIYKCWSMGLLPTESSDWLAWRQPRVPLEFSPLYP
ncbi:DUF1077-domain-containing protein [Acaromyces ingoldii]|uniref:ER membrane protein complex subunit 4 n=1 Tax=Acaromyces ingoldii TaxID=215250 RepID=A0A316YGW1_9BASI|nr:DUF1077-domain-containing protein [Acaromyces ingoldii]PWN88402.1 DUF1077-domain-containing protein [Acaromyces ingoldii]